MNAGSVGFLKNNDRTRAVVPLRCEVNVPVGAAVEINMLVRLGKVRLNFPPPEVVGIRFWYPPKRMPDIGDHESHPACSKQFADRIAPQFAGSGGGTFGGEQLAEGEFGNFHPRHSVLARRQQ